MDTATSLPDPRPCIEMAEMPSLAAAGVAVHRIPVIRATEANIRDYGRFVSDYEAEDVIIRSWPQPDWRPVEKGTGNQGGIREGDFLFERVGGFQVARNMAVAGHYVTGWFEDPAVAADAMPAGYDTVYVREANYHPDGGQVFYPADGKPFIALLAAADIGDNVEPEDFIGFYFDGTIGLQIWPGTWHQPLYPLAARAHFRGKQGAVHACVACDTIKEFGCYLALDLREPAA